MKSVTAERFLKYVSFNTQSNESGSFPSSEGQLELGRYLVEELRSAGLVDAEIDGNGYVYATLPASPGSETKPVLAYIAHMDVSDAAPADDIVTRIVSENGKNVIVTDGRTLLGADDKAGIAEIVSAVERMASDPSLVHPEIRVVFTPDEEIGAGVDRIDMDRVKASYAYTVDGEELGELTYENFNAATATVTFNGVPTHLGNAFGTLKNAILMACDFIAFLPEDMRPETTYDRLGYIHAGAVNGDSTSLKAVFYLRDHDSEGMKRKKELMGRASNVINGKYGAGSCELSIRDSYFNMIDRIVPEYSFLVDNVRDVYTEMGIEPLERPIRGGTDGARLSFMGLPTPNIGTGGLDCHSLSERIAVEDLDTVTEVLVRLARRFA